LGGGSSHCRLLATYKGHNKHAKKPNEESASVVKEGKVLLKDSRRKESGRKNDISHDKS
jgi:hypothetical protein